MAAYFNLTLDTTGPQDPSVVINDGAAYANAQLVDLDIDTSDASKVGYSMKVWGSVDASYDADVQVAEGDSAWISFSATKQVKLSATDGSKTIYVKIRDDVNNVSSQASDSITLDTTVPVATVAVGPDVSKISKQTGKKTCSFSFQSDVIFDEYKVKVVPATGSIHSSGTLIPTTAGSTNMSGSAGSYPATTNIDCTIEGTDLETASSGDGTKIVKVFVKDTSGLWST